MPSASAGPTVTLTAGLPSDDGKIARACARVLVSVRPWSLTLSLTRHAHGRRRALLRRRCHNLPEWARHPDRNQVQLDTHRTNTRMMRCTGRRRSRPGPGLFATRARSYAQAGKGASGRAGRSRETAGSVASHAMQAVGAPDPDVPASSPVAQLLPGAKCAAMGPLPRAMSSNRHESAGNGHAPASPTPGVWRHLFRFSEPVWY